MTAHRLLDHWEAPQGFRLASVIATTYELQADFLEEDLLPVALGLRLPPARGRDFRLELEHAVGDTEVSIFFHPGRKQGVVWAPIPETIAADLRLYLEAESLDDTDL